METVQTIKANVINHEPVEFVIDGITIPVVVGFNRDGTFQTERELANKRQRVDPADCNHACASWSTNISTYCPDCGAAMFLPPRLLAYLPGDVLAEMDELWSAAGWPEWHGESWHVNDYWRIVEHPLFDHCGGLPVRIDREFHYAEALREVNQ